MEQTVSPFPGMDPFLEEPGLWGSVHTRLMNSISDQLADRISPHFYVDIQQHVTVVDPDAPSLRQHIVPDLYVAEQRHERSQSTGGALHITPPTLIEPVYAHEIIERHLEIRDRLSREVVTIIEVLSPRNKASNADGFDAFQAKRRRVMATSTHWIEIDLLRAGKRPPEVAGESDYYALLKRGDGEQPYEVWYFDLRDPMPTIAVPLRTPFADVPLDIQAAFDDVYRRAHYADSVDYRAEIPPPRLSPADAHWVQERIGAWFAARSEERE